MTSNEKEMMNSIFAKIAELDYIKPDEIPIGNTAYRYGNSRFIGWVYI